MSFTPEQFACMTSATTSEWSTPQDFYDALDSVFRFTLDVCATHGNAKCDAYFTEAEDGLKQPWVGTCWMNPPYGRVITAWMKKAYESARAGATVVCLVPSRTDTKWWHAYAMKGVVEFVKGRLKFGGCTENAPFPCAVVVFLPGVP